MEWKTSDRDAREDKVPTLRASLPCRVESSKYCNPDVLRQDKKQHDLRLQKIDNEAPNF